MRPGPVLVALLLLAGAASSAEEYFRDEIATIEPFKRRVGRGRKVVIKGRLRNRFRSPELILIAPGGKTYLNDDNTISGTDFTFRVKFKEGKGPYRLEVIARNKNRIVSAARFHIFYGVRPTPLAKEKPLPTGPVIPVQLNERVIEKRFVSRLNKFRKKIGVKPVAWNEGVASRAREHAQLMAQAGKLLHRLGGKGVKEHLQESGPLGEGWSGRMEPWKRVDAIRPFDRPAPALPGPRTLNHVVLMVQKDHSIEVLFERIYLREPAFRICAADPNCLQVAVGVQRQTRNAVPRAFYFAVCFVQLNDKTILRDQKKVYAELLKAAPEGDPDLLRRLGIWGRADGIEVLRAAWKSDSPKIAAAGFDALLLLQEKDTREAYRKMRTGAAELLRLRRYSEAVAGRDWIPEVKYDHRLRKERFTFRNEVEKAAREELEKIREIEDPAVQRERLQDLLTRSEGLAAGKRARTALKKLPAE